jgi:glycosyltransferase involved in cell wall biosynthesis
MKILFLCPNFYPHVGGIENHVLKLSLELINLGHRVTVVTKQYESSLDLEEMYQKIHIYRIPKLQATKKQKIWSWLKKNQKLAINSDIIHAHDTSLWLLPAKLTYLKNTPIYSTFYSYPAKQPVPISFRIRHKISHRLSYKTVCVGDFLMILLVFTQI